METILWERVKEIFDAALDLPPGERPSFIKSFCGDNEPLRTEVENLLEADAQVGGFLESGWFTSPIEEDPAFSLSKDEVVCGRYRVLRRLGEGGMGEVYQAYDTELGVPVALKTLRPDVASNLEMVQRFRREVRIARQITHPNVCRTFDLERDTRPAGPTGEPGVELTFITMEYLDGETLQQKLRRDGRLPSGQALPIARQIAAALDAAHETGIIHRDVKPGNVMICATVEGDHQSTRAVVTDFGLAKSRNAREMGDMSSLSQPGSAMGTLAYMSPEQRESRELGAATDIYSFGLVLLEMLTGEKAWPQITSLAAALQAGQQTLGSLRKLYPDIPNAWEAALLRCLQTDPEIRFKRAADVLAAIEGTAPHPLSGWPSSRGSFPASRRLTMNQGMLAAAFFVCVALLAWALRMYVWKASVAAAPGTLIYMAPLQNETGEKKLNNVIQLLRAGLNQSPNIKLLDPGADGDYLQKMTKPPDTVIDPPIAREIAMRAGAARVVLTTLTRSHNGYALDVELEQMGSSPLLYRNRWRQSFAWQATEQTKGDDVMTAPMLAAVRDASDWIRREAGESAHDIAQLGLSPEDVTTRSWQALTSYANAEKLLASGHKEDAMAQLEEATRRDPGFARAHADLADNLISIGRRPEGYQEYLNALNSGTRERLSRKERDFIKGTFANDTRDYATALAAFRDYSAFYENDFDAWFYQAYPLDMLDRPVDAIHALERADPLGATPHMVAGQMVYNYMLLGDYAAVHSWMEVLIRTKHENLANTLSGIEFFLKGDSKASLDFLQRNQQSNDHNYRFMGYTLASRVLAEGGRYANALQIATAGLDALGYAKDQGDDTGLLWADRGAIECHMDHYTQCLADLTEALRWNKSPDEMLILSTILGEAMTHLSFAERQEAVALLRKMERSLPSDDLGLVYALARGRLHGEIALAQHELKAALEAFRKADTLDSPLFAREYLARALLASAAVAPNRIEAQAMREEALRIYAHTAARPASVWRTAWSYPPGFVGDQMASYLVLAKSLGRNDAETQAINKAFSKMRKLSPSPSVGIAAGSHVHATIH